jgi:hypothetical protein
MSRPSLNLIVEGIIVTAIVNGFVLTTAATVKPAPAHSTPVTSTSQVDRLPVPVDPSPANLVKICIGKHAQTICAVGDDQGKAEKIILQPPTNPSEFSILGNITLFSGNAMDPHAVGGKVQLFNTP